MPSYGCLGLTGEPGLVSLETVGCKSLLRAHSKLKSAGHPRIGAFGDKPEE